MATMLDRLAPAGRRVAGAARRRSTAIAPGQPVGVTIDDVTVGYQTPDGVVDAVIDASIRIPAGSTTVLLGPSGCGKTSLLRAIAGLERPRTGVVTIGGTTVSAVAHPSRPMPDHRPPQRNAWVKPERRSVGMVFQDGALFPHLTVADNIAFGLRDRRAARGRVDELLELVDLAGLGDRLPDTLSGGQQQRVALARSLAPNPSVLLLDEPFSALDAGLRVQVRSEVARILRDVGVTSIFVTHDQDEAFVLGDAVAVMRDGRIEQYGTPDELYRTPVNRWVAEFVGEANLLAGPVTPNGDAALVQTVIGPVPLARSDDADDTSDGPNAASPDATVTVVVRPEQVAIGSTADDAPTAEIVAVEYYGHDVRYELLLADGATIAARTTPHVLLDVGELVGVSYEGAPTEPCP
ncbi:MAG: ABC transporter ATP-binding protein, partial [Actinomycetota bacterium]